MIITINGADGSGKSTILKSLAEITDGDFTHRHSRPGNVLPKHNTEKSNRYVACPDLLPKYKMHLQLVKIGLFIMEFQTFALWHKILPRHKIAIFERSLVDLYVHPARYGLDTWVVERLRPLLVDWYADLNICLIGDANMMAKRKQELVVADIIHLNNRYQAALEPTAKKRMVIDTTCETVSQSRDKIIAHLKNIL